MESILIAGLGNPGKEYLATRHNAGFMALDFFAAKQNLAFDLAWKKDAGACCKKEIAGKTVYLLKPMKYMNLSGEATADLARFFKIPPQNCLIVFDDISIPLGSLRMRERGSAGGHNGMKDIIKNFATQAVPRLRIGIGPKPAFFDGKDFVLSRFAKAEARALEDVFENNLSPALMEFITWGAQKAMNKANRQQDL
jgi:PTH1 family peptidyl-tRNA hydrolase